MDIILLIAIIFLVVGVVLLLAGHLVPTVPPGAVSAGWGLIGLGVVLLVVWLIVGAVDTADVGHDRGMVAGVVLWPLWRLVRRFRRSDSPERHLGQTLL
jgi:hypothetical protein